MPLIQLIVVQCELPPLASVVHRIEEQVDASLAGIRDPGGLKADWRTVGEVDDGECGGSVVLAGVLLQPLAKCLVPPPVATSQLCGR